MTWYVYALIDPENTKPFYIGKGKGRRARWHLTATDKFNRWKCRRIERIRKRGLEPTITYLYTGLSEAEAFEFEIREIARYGRRPDGLLCNMTDGGEGKAGCVPSQLTKDKIAASMRGEQNPFYGKHHTSENLIKIGNVNRGKHLSADWRKKISDFQKGRPKSVEQRIKTSNALKGRVRSAEHNRRLGESNRGRVVSEATRLKLSFARKGRKLSEETKEKMKLAWAKRRAALSI